MMQSLATILSDILCTPKANYSKSWLLLRSPPKKLDFLKAFFGVCRQKLLVYPFWLTYLVLRSYIHYYEISRALESGMSFLGTRSFISRKGTGTRYFFMRRTEPQSTLVTRISVHARLI